MIHKVFTIWDSAASAYLPPFVLPETAMAIRSFKQCVNDDGHQFGKTPEDYTLFHVGEFNDGTGRITMRQENTKLANGLELVTPSPQLPLQLGVEK